MEVVAAGRYDELLAGFTDTGKLIVDGVTTEGEPLLRVWSPVVPER